MAFGANLRQSLGDQCASFGSKSQSAIFRAQTTGLSLMGNQQSNGTTKKPQGAGPEQEIDAAMEFYQECAERVGMDLKDWLESEPF